MKYLFFVLLAFFAGLNLTVNGSTFRSFASKNYADTSRPVAGKPLVDSTVDLNDSTLLATDSTGAAKYRSSGTGGRVNVKGYYRKNGTYVKPYTRSAPRSHH